MTDDQNKYPQDFGSEDTYYDEDPTVYTESEPVGTYENDIYTGEAEVEPEEKSSKNGTSFLKFLGIILFVFVLLVNYLSAATDVFPNTQAEITDTYTNLLAPAGFTFSIWSVIYIGVGITLAAKFINKNNPEFIEEYQKLQPFQWAWMILNIGWIFTFVYDQIAISSFLIVLYTLALGYLSYKVTSTPVLSANPLLLKWPIGLHFGWMIVATFANITTFLVKVGLRGTAFSGLLWTIVALILIVLASLYFFNTHRNVAIFIPTLWTLIGIMVKQSPTSSFPEASTTIFIFSIVLLVAGVGLASIYIFRRFQDRT